MFETFLWNGLPYLALVLLVGGSIWRFRRNRFGYSALSSQFLERKKLLWGSTPWHIGLLVIFLGHLAPFVAPGLWQSLVANRAFLLTVETIGVAAGVIAFAGLAVLAARRVFSARLQKVTSVLDLVLIGLLMAQVAVGLDVALRHRWGAQWSAGTLAPWLWGVLTLRPDAAYVTGLPPAVKLHLIGAFLIFALLPFTRLVHAFSLPVPYLWRPPQRVVWNNPRRQMARPVAVREVEDSRRLLLKGAGATAMAGVLLGAGVADKFWRFFRGPEMTHEEEVALLRKRIDRLQMTAEERELQLERMRKPVIEVARLAELNRTRGKYLIDYQMRPALAFTGADGLPVLISAKCTHLGCTVAADVDPQGRLLCPCHISYFDLKDGKPNAGSPAKAPLPLLGWALTDAAGAVLARRRPGGAVEGTPDAAQLATAVV